MHCVQGVLAVHCVYVHSLHALHCVEAVHCVHAVHPLHCVYALHCDQHSLVHCLNTVQCK